MRMKIFSARQPRRPLKRSELLTCVVINQLATPGLGSLLARRFVAGTGQLLLALIGSGLFVGWFIQKMRLLYGQIIETQLSSDAGSRLLKGGLIIFAAAWIWALLTSLQLIRTAPKDSIPPLPPVL